ncbi:MAG: aminopeptidase [Chloroflexi bacterium HGW-Chloroflexi-4]|jgi:endoglucanase|nr:MAG: aminopeptidase [Chloroflexi bacterium HGW-Chloroflexi-4]
MKNLIKKLTETSSPSGYESAIREVIRAEISSLSTNIKVDALGNLIVTMGKKTDKGLRIMIAAHMDEIGVIVSHVEKNGLVRFSNLGTILPQYLVGSRVVFLNGVRGVINQDRPDDLHKIMTQDKHFIDVGAASDKDCPLKIGDVGVFDRGFVELGKRVSAKSLDDRVSCAVMIEVMKTIKNSPHELAFVFSTQEEVQSKGATTAAYEIEPDLAIALDVTPSLDIVGVKMQVDLGKGPAIKVRDVGMLSDPRMVRWMEETAKKNNIAYQLEVLDIGTTDAKVMQISKAGMPTGALSIPCRYVHSPSEVLDMDDVQATVTLLTALLNSPVSLE